MPLLAMFPFGCLSHHGARENDRTVLREREREHMRSNGPE